MSNANSLIDKNNIYSQYWENVKESDLPSYANKIITIDFEEFKKKYHNNNNTKDKKDLIKSLLDGDIYILKNSFEKNILEKLKDYVIKEKFSKKNFEFHKVLDGVPNFSRNITPDLAKNYSIIQIKMSSYWFPFNEDKETFKIFQMVYPKWRTLKYISGYKEDIFEKNIPSDGLVDRIQVVRYPLNTGVIEPHTDPYLYQRFFISSYFSKKGIDYNEGGFYAFDKNKKEVDVEKILDIGDLCFGLATIKHGVNEAKGSGTKNLPPTDLRSGRWFLGIYTMESDYSKERHTSKKANVN